MVNTMLTPDPFKNFIAIYSVKQFPNILALKLNIKALLLKDIDIVYKMAKTTQPS